MKIKQKPLIISLITLLTLSIVFTLINENKSKYASINHIESLPLTHKYINTNFYYNQLTQIEKNVYNKIIKKLNSYEGGEIILDENISVNNLSRIADAIRFNNNNNYFYSLFTLPFTSDNQLVNWGPNQNNNELEENKISKILLELYIGENDTRLNNFDISDKLIVTNYNDKKNIFEDIPNELINKYNSIKSETDTMLENIISNMPKNLTQVEAIDYFSNWIIDNMSYTDSFTYGTNYGDIVNEEIQFSSSISSITNKSAVCSGLSMILSELCRKVGIESYVCLGTVSNGGTPFNHAWVAIIIGDTVYYKDPTKEVSAGKIFPLKTKGDLSKGSYILRFSNHFKY